MEEEEAIAILGVGALQFWFGSLLFYFVNVVKMTSLQFAALLYSPVLLRFCTGWCTDV